MSCVFIYSTVKIDLSYREELWDVKEIRHYYVH